MTEQATAAYVQRHGITVDVSLDRGSQVADGWEHHAYVLTLTDPTTGATLTDVPWMQGNGTSPIDTPSDVLDALISETVTAHNAESFEDFADEFGYDVDSRSAERIYLTLQAQAPRVVAFFGGMDEFEAVAYADGAE